MEIETHLIKRIANFPKFCTNCDKKISAGEAFQHEEGVKEHLHSLIARHFCFECYAKYGEKKLLSGIKK